MTASDVRLVKTKLIPWFPDDRQIDHLSALRPKLSALAKSRLSLLKRGGVAFCSMANWARARPF